jgi:hypothetical protein
MKTVAVLPVDDRPVNYDYPRLLGRAAGLDVTLPPREWLGNPWRDSRHDELVRWVDQASRSADALIVSIDTLGYGGLIPSRRSTESADAVLRRLEVLRTVQARRRDLPILASSVVLRINRSNSSEEERPYCATYGARLFRLSFLEHKAALGEATAAERSEHDALRAEIPREYYDDYRAGRARNHAVNRAMLEWAAEGIFDYLILPQDDTGEYGWNIAEARVLQQLIRSRGLTARAITYPGADEIGCLLLARYVCRLAGLAPRVWPRYSGVGGAAIVTAYEDRPIHELLKAHLAPLHGVVAESVAASDLSLYINAPVRRQGHGDSQWIIAEGPDVVRARLDPAVRDWFDRFVDDDGFRATRREMELAHRSPEEFIRALRAEVRTGRPVAIADVAFVNGADLVLCDLLRPHPEIAQLAAYGGWNTAGNTLGTVLAQAVIQVAAMRGGATHDQLAAQLEFLFLRLVDDDLYQARERTRSLLHELPRYGLAPTMERLPDAAVEAVEAAVREHLVASSGPLRDTFIASGLVRDVRLAHIHLPWRRLFEVGLEVSVDLAR